MSILSMVLPTSSRETPKLEAQLDALNTKRQAADTSLSAAEAEFQKLSAAFELQDESGLVVSAKDLEKAAKTRDAARQVSERMNLAVAEATKRLDDARKSDARRAEDLAWEQTERASAAADVALSHMLEQFGKAHASIQAYLEKRRAAVDLTPDFDVRFYSRAGIENEGLDRILHLLQLQVLHFHPGYLRGPAFDHEHYIAKAIQGERQFLNELPNPPTRRRVA